MPVGIVVNKDVINNQVGRTSSNFMNLLDEIAVMDDSLAPYDTAALVAFGFTSGEAATIGSIRSELNQLRQIAMGLATLSPAKDFRTFPRQASGIRA
jgi:hypothetical protein